MPETEITVVSCCICRQPISLEKSVTDDQGRAVHTDCYLKSVRERMQYDTGVVEK